MGSAVISLRDGLDNIKWEVDLGLAAPASPELPGLPVKPKAPQRQLSTAAQLPAGKTKIRGRENGELVIPDTRARQWLDAGTTCRESRCNRGRPVPL